MAREINYYYYFNFICFLQIFLLLALKSMGLRFHSNISHCRSYGRPLIKCPKFYYSYSITFNYILLLLKLVQHFLLLPIHPLLKTAHTTQIYHGLSPLNMCSCFFSPTLHLPKIFVVYLRILYSL